MWDEAYIVEETSANFAALVLDNSLKGSVLVDFWVPWAGRSLRRGELLRRSLFGY